MEHSFAGGPERHNDLFKIGDSSDELDTFYGGRGPRIAVCAASIGVGEFRGRPQSPDLNSDDSPEPASRVVGLGAVMVCEHRIEPPVAENRAAQITDS